MQVAAAPRSRRARTRRKHEEPADDDIIPPTVAAKILQCSESTLERWRSRDGGPPFSKFGRKIFYSRAELRAWLKEDRRGKSTKDFESYKPSVVRRLPPDRGSLR